MAYVTPPLHVYCVSYDLKVPNRDYTGLYMALKSFGQWWHYLDSTWLIATSDNDAVYVWNILATHIDPNDFLLVIEVNNNYNGWLPKEAWDWLATKFAVG